MSCTNTGISGEYELGLVAGSYKVRFASFGAPGYVPQFYKGKGTFPEADAVAVSGGKTTAGIDVEMQEGAAVTGTVTDASSTPIEGLQVCTATAQFMVGECTMTDAAGHYTLAGLAPGEYKIVFTNNDGCGPEGCTRLNYLVQYWNNKSSFGEATPIALTAGEIESGVNAKMQKGASISGTVVNTAKSPLKGIQVCAMPVGAGFGDCRQTGSNGSYSLVGLSTGEYRISFQPEEGSYYLAQYYDHKDRFNQADILSVVAGEAKAGIGAELKEGGAVTGTVTDISHIAIQGLQVCAYEAAGSQFGERFDCAPTSSGGEYRLRLPAGSYKVQFTNNVCGPEGCEQINYVSQYYNGTRSWEAATAVGVGKGATTAGIDAQMEVGAEISGTVTDVGEAPLKGIQVCARGDSEEQNALGGCAQTNAAGEYTIPGLAAGDYRVEFTGNSCGPEGCFQLNYVRQYYDGKTRFDEADLLSLAPGDVETGIDAEMVEGAEISGTVTDAAEQPLEGIQVCAQDASGEAEEPGGCATTDANGEYTITGIPAGDYKVEFSGESCNEEGCFQSNWVRQYYDGKTRFDEADLLSLAPGDVETGIDAEMVEGAEISGTVTDAGSAPIEGIQVCVQDASGEGEESAGCAQTDASGEYTIAGIPAGSFKVEFSGETCNEEGCFQSNWVRQYYDGKTRFDEADVLSLAPGDVETGIDARMVEGATIQGTVTDAATEDPIEGIQVCVQDASGEGEESAGCAQTDASGEYTIAGIPAGSFKVEFSGESCNEEGCFQTNWVPQYYNGKRNFDEADVLSLASGDVETGIDAALEEGGSIGGTVIDAASEAPIEGLMVCANSFEGEGMGGCDSTDESGEYEIGGLPAGEYKVEFSNSICPEEEECFQSYYLHQWFDEKQGWDQADPVTVQAGQTTPEIDAALEEGGAIRGTVTDALGAPLQESGVCAYALGASEEEATECTGTGEMGHYMLVVPAGVYKVGFYYLDWPAGYFSGKIDFGVADSVSVTQGTTHDGIDAVLRPAAPVNTAPPSLTGNPAVGQVLSCSKGNWEHDPTSFAYAWRSDAALIAGQSAPTYTVQPADPGHGISCEVTASNAGGSATAKSNTLQVPTTLPPPAVPAEEAPKEVGIAAAPATAKVKNGKAMLPLACKATVSCKGVVKLFSGSQIGKASFSIPAGQTKTIAVKLTSKGKQLLKKAGKKGLTVTLKGSGVKTRKLTLKPS